MMTINSNYHTHIYLCKHAEGTIDDYIMKAITLNYKIIGISDHAPLNDYLKSIIYSRRMSKDEYEQIYLPDLNRAIEKYKDQIIVLKAVEIEYFPQMKQEYIKYLKDLDYLILGQHYIFYEGNYISVYSQLNIPMIYAYAKQVIEGIKTGYFKILAHPDLFCWGYPFWDDVCSEISKEIIKTAIEYNVVLEINANGIRNCEEKLRYITIPDPINKAKELHNYAYPRIEFFELAKELGAKIIINDDSHSPNHFHDNATLEAYELANKLGIKPINEL